MKAFRLVTFLVPLALAGCGRKDELMPMAEGRSWTYQTRSGFQSFVEPVRVTRSLSVGDAEGFELSGPLGVSRLAWEGSRLVADETGNARFTPPIPLLDRANKRALWSGWLEFLGKRQPAKAELTQSEAKLTLNGREFPTMHSVLSVRTANKRFVLDTWFEPQVGIVQQEQRTNDELDLQMQLVRG